MESSHQNTSDHAIFKCLAKICIFVFIMGSQLRPFFRSEQDGGRVKWKTTDAILFPQMMSISCGHDALRLVTEPNDKSYHS